MVVLYRTDGVMTNKLKPTVVEQMIDVALRAGEEIIDANDVRAACEQAIKEMRAEEASTPGNQYAHFKIHVPAIPLNYAITYDTITALRAIMQANFLPRKQAKRQKSLASCSNTL
jgi:hypothetical protein